MGELEAKAAIATARLEEIRIDMCTGDGLADFTYDQLFSAAELCCSTALSTSACSSSVSSVVANAANAAAAIARFWDATALRSLTSMYGEVVLDDDDIDILVASTCEDLCIDDVLSNFDAGVVRLACKKLKAFNCEGSGNMYRDMHSDMKSCRNPVRSSCAVDVQFS